MTNALIVPHFSCEEIRSALLTEKKLRLWVARLDKIHPIVSGNKLFKLFYFVEKALSSPSRTIITFGGAYSNHLVATAWYCKMAGIRCIGIVRGEAAENLSHSLQDCINYGMELKFISRSEYVKDNESTARLLFPGLTDEIIVPEGGYHPLGATGSALIMKGLTNINATHICTALGTATTMAGLLKGCHPNQTIIGIPVLKNMTDIKDRLQYLLDGMQTNEPVIFDAYHFGGYAKKNEQLIKFMNDFYSGTGVPTDFVYTAKMFYGVIDQVEKNYFPEGSAIVCLHTGGLQGNLSLPAGTLVF
jgi:1-aminocyclopropane-1-carboxylate deaminase